LEIGHYIQTKIPPIPIIICIYTNMKNAEYEREQAKRSGGRGGFTSLGGGGGSIGGSSSGGTR
jgi:uncharacterized membrane protein YgcG